MLSASETLGAGPSPAPHFRLYGIYTLHHVAPCLSNSTDAFPNFNISLNVMVLVRLLKTAISISRQRVQILFNVSIQVMWRYRPHSWMRIFCPSYISSASLCNATTGLDWFPFFLLFFLTCLFISAHFIMKKSAWEMNKRRSWHRN